MRMLTSFLVRALWNGLNYPICVRSLGMAPSQHQHCTDEAQKAETVLSAVSYMYLYIRMGKKTKTL